MTSFRVGLLRNISIYYLKASAFSVVSYLLLLVVYGGVRLTFLLWYCIVLLAFTIAYIPFFIRLLISNKEKKEVKEKEIKN